jgi:outer membrane receptor for ferrienterochelin and colicins
MKFITFVYSLLFSVNLLAQTYSISGKITDEKNKPLLGVNIVVLGTEKGAASNLSGDYNISKLSLGTYNIKFSIIGYKSAVRSVQVLNKQVHLDVVLNEEAVQTDQVVVTANKFEQKISDLPVSAEVIPFQDFTKKDISNLEDAMRYAPGVNLIDDQISIRGSSGYSKGAGTRVLLELDGIPFYTGDTGDIIWESLPVNEIERVEIIKGAASSLYGSTAIGGVVNVITKDISKTPVTYIKTYVGMYDKPSYSEWDWSEEYRMFNGLTISHSQSFGKFGLSLSLSRLEDDSYEQSGFFKRYIGYLKSTYDFSETNNLTFFINTLNQHTGNFLYWKDLKNALVPPDADQGQTISSNRYMFGLIYNNYISNKFTLKVNSSYYLTNWSDQTSSHDTSTTNLFRTEVQGNYKLSDGVILIGGVEGSETKIKSNIFGRPSGAGFGAYIHTNINFNFPLTLSAGIRYDYSKLDSIPGFNAFSPKFGLNYKLSDNLILRSSIGTGFRAPSPSEAFTSTAASGIIVKPNLQIKPEHSFSFEVGVNYQALQNLNLDAAFFNNEFYDYIEPEILIDNFGSSYVQFENITRARIRGSEVDVDYDIIPGIVKFSAGYTYLWARDLTANKALKYRPRNMLYASLDYKFLDFDLGADFRYLSRVEEIDNLLSLIVPDADQRVPIYVLDLRGEYTLTNFDIPARVCLNVKNALNYNYVELIGNLAPIRNYSLSLEFFF